MEFRLHHLFCLYNVFCGSKDSENCAQLVEEEIMKIPKENSLNDEHDCNVASMNSLNIHDANDMQSHKLGDAMFDEDDIFSPPSFDEQICYDNDMPTIYDDYDDDMYAIKSDSNHETCHHDFNIECGYVNQVSHDSYFVEFALTTLNEKKIAYVESDKFSYLQ